MYEDTISKSYNLTKMDFQVDDEVILEPYPKRYGCSVILLSMFFFQLVNKLITRSSKPPKSEREFWEWKNVLISWTHAGIVSVWNATSMYVYWEDMKQDLVAYHNPVLYSLVAFTSGYFIYDFMDICRNIHPSEKWEVLVHHCVVTAIFVYNVMICRCLAFNTIALMVEYNSFFLHSRKLLQKHLVPFDYWFYRLSVWANIISFVLFRFGPVIVISYAMTIWKHRVTSLNYWTLFVAVATMHCINMVLFYRLVKTDVFRYNRQWKARHQPTTSLNNNVKECGDGHTNGYIKPKAS